MRKWKRRDQRRVMAFESNGIPVSTRVSIPKADCYNIEIHTCWVDAIAGQNLIMSNQPSLVEAVHLVSMKSLRHKLLQTHLTRSLFMISMTSRVPRSSRPDLESPSLMLSASISNAELDRPACAWSENVESGVY